MGYNSNKLVNQLMKTNRNKLSLLAFILIAGLCQAQKDPLITARKYGEAITEDDMKEMLQVYASDAFQGRKTGEEGEQKAINYISDFYGKIGITPGVSGSNYFQKVPLQLVSKPTGTFKIKDTVFKLGEEVFLMTPNAQKFDAKDFVFVGTGIGGALYNDYVGLKLKGKVIVATSASPDLGKKRDFPLPEAWSDPLKLLSLKYDEAVRRGAKALIIVSNDEVIQRAGEYYKSLESGTGFRIKSLDKENIPLLVVSEKVGKKLYPRVYKKNRIKRGNAKIAFASEGGVKDINANNVVGYIKGQGNSNEYVVISAHLDHLGVDADGDVYNGADDDGSGTVSVLQIAKAFKQAVDEGHKPRRTIVFLNFTGEEEGLLGSTYYTSKPIFPITRTVADLNIDMIGRVDPKREGDDNYLYLIGSDKLSKDLHNLSEEVNKNCCGINLDYKYNDENDPNNFYYRSDHYNFAKNNVPVIFYFNGVHEDYHKVSDTPDKIRYDLLAKRTKLIFYTAWAIANRKEKIQLDSSK